MTITNRIWTISDGKLIITTEYSNGANQVHTENFDENTFRKLNFILSGITPVINKLELEMTAIQNQINMLNSEASAIQLIIDSL